LVEVEAEFDYQRAASIKLHRYRAVPLTDE
jgi:hypothetical protein